MGRSDARVVRLERAAGIGACGDRPCLRCTLAGEPFGDVQAARKLCNGGPHDLNFVEHCGGLTTVIEAGAAVSRIEGKVERLEGPPQHPDRRADTSWSRTPTKTAKPASGGTGTTLMTTATSTS